MSKTKSGWMLFLGLLCCLICILAITLIQETDYSIEYDTTFVALKIFFGAAAIGGMVAFFFGCLQFARGAENDTD